MVYDCFHSSSLPIMFSIENLFIYSFFFLLNRFILLSNISTYYLFNVSMRIQFNCLFWTQCFSPSSYISWCSIYLIVCKYSPRMVLFQPTHARTHTSDPVRYQSFFPSLDRSSFPFLFCFCPLDFFSLHFCSVSWMMMI